MGQESTLVLRYAGQFLGQRDCDIFDRSGKLLGSVIDVERTPHPHGRFALANLRVQTFDLRDPQSRCVRRIEGPSQDHENSVIVTDQHGTEVVAIKCPDKIGLSDLLLAAIGRSRFPVEAGGQPLGSMTVNGQVYDTANNRVGRVRFWGGSLWRTPEYRIMLIEPLHEELRVVAIAAVMLQQRGRKPSAGGGGDAAGF